ncbi:MAG: alpha/beta hydrolase [Verrucomicrobiales bacterium]
MKLLLFIVVVVLVVLAFIYFGQGRMIYFPRRYAANFADLEKADAVSYVSRGHEQRAFVVNNAAGTTPDRVSPDRVSPDRVWWLFGGNGSVALDWLSLVRMVDPSIDQAFILFDYPGYGLNGGRPHPISIRKSVDDSIPALAEALGLTPEDLTARSVAVGLSLGAAVALDTANRHAMHEVVAISPFTTMRAMADRQFGGVLSPLLSHHYDNETAIDDLLQRDPSASVTIFHGEDDLLVPDKMGRALADRDPSGEHVRYRSVPGFGHNDILRAISGELIAMFERTSDSAVHDRE